MTTVRQFADYFGEYQGGIDPHLPPYNCKGDAWRGNDGQTFGDNRFKVPSYKFSAGDVGKVFICDQSSTRRTITDVPDPIGDPHVCTVSGSVMTAGTSRAYTFGTDDTAGLQLALDHARYSVGALESGAWTRGGFGGEVADAHAKYRAMGRLVVLRSGHKYFVHNTQAQFDAGKTAALLLHRRHGLVADGDGTTGTEIICGPTIVGEVIGNVNARQQTNLYNHPSAAYADYITVANFSIFGNRKMAGNGGYHGMYFHPSFEGYPDIDPRLNVMNIKADQCGGYGILLNGRMNGIYENLSADQNVYGVGLINLNDTTVIRINTGGNSKAGVVVDKAHACCFTHIYSYFSGAGGGSVENDSCNLLVKADQARNGFNQFDVVHLQESRGPALVVDNSGYNTFSNMTCRDPGRNNPQLNGGVLATVNPAGLPAIRSGILLKSAGCIENEFVGTRVQSNVQVWDTPTYTGTHPVHITADPANNLGSVEVMRSNMSLTGRPNMPDVTLTGGAGVSNGKNTGLKVNGTALG